MSDDVKNSQFIELGVVLSGNRLLWTIGDTLGLTAIAEMLYEKEGILSIISTAVPELFLNNPYVTSTSSNIPKIVLYPCGKVDCNIIQHYANQLNIDVPEGTKPKIFLSPDEINYGKTVLKEFEQNKKIAITLKSSTPAKDLKYEYISPLLDRLKEHGYKLIGVGRENGLGQYGYNKSFINQTTLRQLCAIISQCDLCLSVDTGTFHIAAALDIPQVIFFRNNGQSNNAYFDTYFNDSKFPCQTSCLYKGLLFCEYNNKCLENFDLEWYYNKTVEILSK
jgi:hypothetical protein